MISYEECRELLKKYTTRNEFCKRSNTAYKKSLTKGWLDDFTRVRKVNKPCGYWNYERCYEVVKGFISKKKFEKAYKSAYIACLKNNWLQDFDWFFDYSLTSTDLTDCVYAYIFQGIKTTIIKEGRIENTYNRNTANEKFEIWGHGLGDLWIEKIKLNPTTKTILVGVGS